MIMFGNCIRKLSHFSQLQLIKVDAMGFILSFSVPHSTQKNQTQFNGGNNEERPHKYLLVLIRYIHIKT